MGKTRITPNVLHDEHKFCAGCGHGTVFRMVAEVLEEKGLDSKAIGIVAVGCSGIMVDSFGIDWIQAQHGRAAAVATGVKRVRNDNFVLTYQGDGDALCIGIAETLNAAIRNENITTIVLNNGVFGMTGGQMSSTTLIGQKTKTSTKGRNEELHGQPLDIFNLLKNFNVAYLARGTITNFKEINKTKNYIRKAVEAQLNNKGYSMVEIVAPCPTNWKLDPVKCMKRIEDEFIPYYKLGEFTNGEVI